MRSSVPFVLALLLLAAVAGAQVCTYTFHDGASHAIGPGDVTTVDVGGVPVRLALEEVASPAPGVTQHLMPSITNLGGIGNQGEPDEPVHIRSIVVS